LRGFDGCRRLIDDGEQESKRRGYTASFLLLFWRWRGAVDVILSGRCHDEYVTDATSFQE
jgi:hypothetical protein